MKMLKNIGRSGAEEEVMAQDTDGGPNPHREGRHDDEPGWCYAMRRELLDALENADQHFIRLEVENARLRGLLFRARVLVPLNFNSWHSDALAALQEGK